MEELINIKDENGKQAVYARELYLGLGLDKSNWSRWLKGNVLNNEFFKENIDWVRVRHHDEGNEIIDFIITLEFGKHIAMMARTEKSHDYRKYFIEVEKQLKEVYHISETALTNNVVKELKEDLFHEIDERFELYEENYRPTHANKLRINKYIKERLGSEQEENEAELVKQRVLLMLNAEHWQDVPYKQLISNLHLIDQSIETVKGSRTRKQMELFNDFV